MRAPLRSHASRGHRRLERRGAGDHLGAPGGLGALQGFSPHTNGVPPLWTLAIAGSNVLIKEALYQYKIRLGRRAGSSAIIANAWDHRADAFSALAVLVGLLLVRAGGPRFQAIDEIAALVVVVVIVTSGPGFSGRAPRS